MTGGEISRQIQDLYDDVGDGEVSEPWEFPIPLEDPIGPPFPVGHLPEVIREMVIAVAEETQTAPDMAASVALGAISAVAGGKYIVGIPELGWMEPVHIQAVIGAEPAQRKTQVFRLMTQPIVDYERTRNTEERLALAHWEAQERVLEKQLAAAETVEGNGVEGGSSDAVARRIAAVEELEEHRAKHPRITQLITDDATPEAVKSLMAGQGGAIAAMSAESAFLSNTVGGRYSDSPNLDVLLNGHAGDRIRVDRKGRPGETIERPCLTLCLMVQPDVIRGMGRSPGFIGRGGAARLLPSFPVDMLGRRRVDVTPVPGQVADAWWRIISAVAGRMPDLENGCYAPWQLRLSTEAKGGFREYRVAHEAEMHREGKYAGMRDWAGKQEGAVLRIAGLLHISDQSTIVLRKRASMP
jgi:replicative DNA helicase